MVNNIHKETKMVPWQKEWAVRFAQEKERIAEAIDRAGLSGEVLHVGSTSIEGMCSKPIIDILLCPDHKIPLETFLPVLEGCGYIDLGECGRPGRYFLSRGFEENDTFYLHLCYDDHPVAQDQTLFRLLEENEPGIRQNYMKWKEILASLFPDDRNAYREIKGLFIESVLAAYRLGARYSRGNAADGGQGERDG